MDKYSDPEIDHLLKDQHNNTCFDCDAIEPKFASVNNSVFVCLNCAELHKELGEKYSLIRSLTTDTWDTEQLKLLSIGGNNRLKSVMQEFGIPLDVKIGSKYKLRALDYYRKMLKAEAFNEPSPSKPSIVSAFEEVNLDEVDNNQVVINQGIQSTQDQWDQNISAPEGQSSVFFFKVGNFFKNSANDIQKNFQELNIKEKANDIGKKANDFGKKANDFGKKAATVIEEKTNEVVTGAFFGKKNVQDISESKQKDSSTDQKNPNSKGDNVRRDDTLDNTLNSNENASQLDKLDQDDPPHS